MYITLYSRDSFLVVLYLIVLGSLDQLLLVITLGRLQFTFLLLIMITQSVAISFEFILLNTKLLLKLDYLLRIALNLILYLLIISLLNTSELISDIFILISFHRFYKLKLRPGYKNKKYLNWTKI